MTEQENTFKRNAILMAVCSLIIGIIIQLSPVVYIPALFMVGFSFFGGVLESKKGWQLAIFQVLIIVALYWANHFGGIYPSVDAEGAFFISHISILPTFIASYLGAFIKKL